MQRRISIVIWCVDISLVMHQHQLERKQQPNYKRNYLPITIGDINHKGAITDKGRFLFPDQNDGDHGISPASLRLHMRTDLTNQNEDVFFLRPVTYKAKGDGDHVTFPTLFASYVHNRSHNGSWFTNIRALTQTVSSTLMGRYNHSLSLDIKKLPNHWLIVFRAILNFRKFKVALNPTYRIFLHLRLKLII